MIFLFLQAAFSSFFGLIIKWVGNRNSKGLKEDIFVIGAINYIVAALAILPYYINGDWVESSPGALWTGGVMGLIYFIGYFFVIYTIKWVGVSATSVVSVLSILMPIVFAAFYWDQQPNTLQVTGIMMALVALTLIGGKKGGMEAERPWFAPIVLFIFFLICGGSRLCQDTFKYVSTPEHRPEFLLAAFVVASIPSLALLFYINVYKRQRLLLSEVIFGVALGLSNILQSHFILKCLEFYPGFIVFPVTSAGGIMITTGIATLMLGEKLNARTYLGIGIAAVSLFLLNWS